MHNKLILTCFFILSLLSCNKDIGKNPAPMQYYIDIDGKIGDKITITYPNAIAHKGEDGESENNVLKTELVTLPFTKLVDFWREDKKIPYPSISFNNNTNDSVTVLLSHFSGTETLLKLDDKRECLIGIIIDYQRLNIKNNYNSQFKAITIDSLHYLLKREKYKWIKVLDSRENTKLELPNNWVN